MLTTDERYLEIVKSNVRPKIEPYITVSGEDADGNEIELQWKPSNIIDMTYKRGIDPTGQTLPYMELTWKEFYFGKLNANNYPEKYNNIVKYMKVDLYFRQDTSKINTWGDVLGGIGSDDTETAKTTWDDFSSDAWNELTGTWDSPVSPVAIVSSDEIVNWSEYVAKTWGQVFKENTSIEIKLPVLFLTAKPTIEGHTITWVARDLLYFLNENVENGFLGNIPWVNHIRWLFLNERGNFPQNFDMINGLSLSQRDAQTTTLVSKDRTVNSQAFFEGKTKDLLKNWAMSQACYFDFKDNYTILKRFLTLVSSSKRTPVFKFSKKIMRGNPKISMGTDISSFSFIRTAIIQKDDEKYTLDPEQVHTYSDDDGNSFDYGEYVFKGYGTTQGGTPGIKKRDFMVIEEDSDNKLLVNPVELNRVVEFFSNKEALSSGEMYVEDNPLNYLIKGDTALAEKIASLNVWYSSKRSAIEINSLHNVALEMGDLVEVETNLYDNLGNAIIKRCVIVGIELNYSGVLKQKTIVREVL